MKKIANYLTYTISTEVLRGQIGHIAFTIIAASGGGRGSTHISKWQSSLASYDPRKPTAGSAELQRGGSIPPGLYWVYPPEWKENKHDSLGVWVSFLKPIGNQANKYPKRTFDVETGFFIHGPGARGSNGCLVIARVQRIPLLKAIDKVGGVPINIVLSDETYTRQDVLRYVLRDGWCES